MCKVATWKEMCCLEAVRAYPRRKRHEGFGGYYAKAKGPRESPYSTKKERKRSRSTHGWWMKAEALASAGYRCLPPREEQW